MKIVKQGVWTRAEQRYFRKIVNAISTRLISKIIKDELGCCNCGAENVPHYALDYHHVGEKYYPIHVMIMSGSMDSYLNELQKCIILCANCHREEHYNANNGSGIWTKWIVYSDMDQR